MNLPVEYRKTTRERVPESVQETIFKYIDQMDLMIRDGLGFLFYGSAGVGKTSTAALLAMEARSRGYTTFFVPVSDLREMIRSHVTFDDSSILDRVRKVRFLVLDGLRAEDARDSLFSGVDLARLMEARTSWKRSTVITTSVGLAKVRDELFPSLWEVARTRCASLEFKGKGHRDDQEDRVRERLGLKKGG